MISKKSRKVVAALLIGATICASGTFAYFNAKTDLDNIEGLADDAQKTLNITNGKIEIQGKIAGVGETDLTSLWGYDVARVSTIKSLLVDDGSNDAFKKAITDTYGYSSANVVDAEEKYNLKAFNTPITASNYITINESPDILGLSDIKSLQEALDEALDNLVVKANALNNGTTYTKTDIASMLGISTGAVPTQKEQEFLDAKNEYNVAKAAKDKGILTRTTRAKVGTGVSDVITNARPGDAFALGAVTDDNNSIDIDAAGITIDNKSNLTTKIGIRINKEKETEVLKQIKSMNANGWKIYIKVINPLASNAGISPYNEWTELTEKSFEGTTAEDPIACAVATVKPGQAAPTLQMRVELPLDTVNYYQDRKTGNGDGDLSTDFDITSMFEIVATQENNPGWNEDGSSTNPVTASSTSTAPVAP